jgi:hypothetical protein
MLTRNPFPDHFLDAGNQLALEEQRPLGCHQRMPPLGQK